MKYLNLNVTDDPVVQYAIENRNYFEWDLEIKKVACERLASWITHVSFMGALDRQGIIKLQIQEAIEEQEFEYVQFVRDVETFFRTKNWDHLNDQQPNN